nr:reverse transcriptase domain-containing protein [Tanacetum cinerariifolium]
NCQRCALLRQELKENLESHSPDFQNTSEPSNATTNVVNSPREPYVVKQDNGCFVDKIIFDLNRAPDSPNQFHCFHCKDVLRDGEACKRCTCKSCGKDAHIGYNCPSKVPVISYPEPCNNQTIDELPQTLPIFHLTFHSEAKRAMLIMVTIVHLKLRLSIRSRVTIKTLISLYDYGQNSCYDSTSIGVDQSQPQQYTVDHPIFNAHNSYLDSQIQLNSNLAKIKDQMTSITSLCELACQVAQKKLEEKQIEEERAAKAKYWKLLVCYDDEDDKERSDSLDDNIILGLPSSSAITPDEPVLSTEEPDNSLSMGDEHLDIIPAMESDEFIKSGVETLIPIPSESEGIPKRVCDVPSHDNSSPLDVSKDQIEDLSESNEEFSSINDDSFSVDDVDYVEASPPDSELVSSEVMEIVIPETKSSSTSLNSLLEETNTFDNSLPEFETFCFDVKEISSGSTTTYPDIFLSEYEAFYDDHVKEISSGSPTTHSDSPLYASFMFDLSINPFPLANKSDSYEFIDKLIPFISALEYECFLFKVESNSRDFTKDVAEHISPTKVPQVINTFPTYPTLQLNMKFQPFSESLFAYCKINEKYRSFHSIRTKSPYDTKWAKIAQDVELKDLPPHLEYAFLEGDNKFPVIIAKYLSMEEKTALITVLKSHK